MVNIIEILFFLIKIKAFDYNMHLQSLAFIQSNLYRSFVPKIAADKHKSEQRKEREREGRNRQTERMREKRRERKTVRAKLLTIITTCL